MCDKLLPSEEGVPQHQQLVERVVAIWGRDRFGLDKDDYYRRVQCYKRLSKLWGDDAVARSHPNYEGGGRWNQGNTVLVDDSLEKARAEPHNLVRIPEYAGLPERPDILPQVHDYINELCFQSDVSTYIRCNPFQAEIETSGGAL